MLIVDEVGYIPFDPEAAALFFALISSRYERSSWSARTRPSRHGREICGDPVAVAAMVDQLVHHAEVSVLKGRHYRLKGKRKGELG